MRETSLMSRPLSSRLAIGAKKMLRRRLRRSLLIRLKVSRKPEVFGVIEGLLTPLFFSSREFEKVGSSIGREHPRQFPSTLSAWTLQTSKSTTPARGKQC
jgi:hypothetical protein